MAEGQLCTNLGDCPAGYTCEPFGEFGICKSTNVPTTITIEPAVGGTGAIIAGLATGDYTRNVTIQANPQNGYRFVEWRVVSSTPPTDEGYPVFAFVSSQPAATLEEVCGPLPGTSTFQQVARVLYNDQSLLYLDSKGTQRAPTGYWGAGLDGYYYWTGGRLPVLQKCLHDNSSGGGGFTGGGGSGGGTDDSRLVS